MNNKIIIFIVVIAVIIVGGYFLFKGSFQSSSAPKTSNQKPISEASATKTPATQENKEYVVTYTDSGYSPNTITAKVGEIVTFKNQSSLSMWTASAIHPSHRIYSGTQLSEHCPDATNSAFDACTGILPGDSWSFKFDKAGSWKYHDHLNPIAIGAIIVE